MLVQSRRATADPVAVAKPATLSLTRDFINEGLVQLTGDGTEKIVIRDGAGTLTNKYVLSSVALEPESREWLFSLVNDGLVDVAQPVTLGLNTDAIKSTHTSINYPANIKIWKDGVLTLRGASFVNGNETAQPRFQAKITGSGKLDRRQIANWKNFGTISPGITQVPAAKLIAPAQLGADDPDQIPLPPDEPQTGILTFLGDYSMEGPANLEIQIGGNTISPGSGFTQYDQLRVAGNAALGGLLDVSIIDDFTPGYRPSHDDVFDILTTEGGAVKGYFTNAIDQVYTTDGLGRFDVTYIPGFGSSGDPGIVRLSNFVAIPEPTSECLLFVAITMMSALAARQRHVD